MRTREVTGGVLLLVALAVVYALSHKGVVEHPLPSQGHMRITSTDFLENTPIPSRYTCDGEDVHPELRFADVPKEAVSLALIVDDPDAPDGTFLHWTIWNVPPGTDVVNVGQVPSNAREGVTGFGKPGYGGPCPPAGSVHRYFFRLYALDTFLDIPVGASLEKLMQAVYGHVVDEATLVGTYKREKIL